MSSGTPLVALCIVAAMLCIGPARADDEAACARITGDAQRLRCYDGAHTRPAEPAPAATPLPSQALPRSIWEQRILEDAARETFTLTGARPSYLLYTHQSRPNREPYRFLGSADRLSAREVKLQLSLQTKVASSLFGDNGDLWAAYTQVAYWQAPNEALSNPFRESNHEPELFLSFLTDFEVLGWSGRSVSAGVVHQSNGQSEPLSRSWNRVYADFQFLRGSFALGFKPWLRIREDATKDDNPDIDDYLGHYEIRVSYARDAQLFSLMARNVFRRYNLELNWSFRIAGRLRGLVQLTSGHGENLIDYNHRNHRIGIGILMSDWL